MFRLMVADFDSPSYFVAVAAVELGFFKHEGIDIELERTYGAHNGVRTPARRYAAFLWRTGLRRDPSLPGLEGRQTSVRAFAIFVLVPGRSRRPRR